jgi:transposase
VQICATVSRFRCRNRSCPRRIFCERLPEVANAYGRQTARTSEIVRIVGYVAGGLPGQRLLARLSISTSDDTVLRRLKQRSGPDVQPVQNVGVDDWAWRKHQTYGTIFVDLDLHRVIDLLPDRSSESMADWLRQHPEIATVSRDRCGLYAEGASIGAPQAQQVADRFHLILNLSATMERVLEERSRELVLPPLEEVPPKPEPEPVCETTSEVTLIACSRSELRRQRRLDRYNEVIALFAAGHSQAAISRMLGMERKTIRRWLRRGQFPERKPAHRPPPKVTDFAEYLQQRWTEGCHNASRLYREIRQKGYNGKRSMVAKFVADWRSKGPSKRSASPEKIAPKHAAVLVTRAADQITTEQQALLERIMIQCPDVYDLRNIALAFRSAMKAGSAGPMLDWIHKAKHCEFGAIVRFAHGLQKDISAVSAAVELKWSTGQVEGQNNRLKMIKRQMYGRAGFTLLRARVLPYTPALSFGLTP